MTDVLNKLSSDREETDRDDSVSELPPTGADAGNPVVVEHALDTDLQNTITVEPLPDWLKPMEDDDDAFEGDKFVKRNAKKIKSDIVKVKRGRGRPPLPKTVRARLNMVKAAKSGSAVQMMSINTLDDSTRSSLSSITDPSPTRTPEALPRTPKSIPQSPISTPLKPLITPTSPAGAITIFSPAEFCTPPRLTRDASLNVEGKQIPCQTPSFQIRQQITPATQNGSVLPLHIWHCPSLPSINPTKTQDAYVDQTVTIGLPDIPGDAVNGRVMEKKEILFLMRDCVGCGCPFPAEKVGDTLCRKCNPEKKYSPPNIIFRKVGQDQWEVGKTKSPQKLNTVPIYKKMIKKDFVPDGADNDDNNWMTRQKRNRRMCRRCEACLRESDCGICDFCMDKPKFGGSNKKRQKCRLRQCQFQGKLSSQPFKGLRSPRRKKLIKQKFKRRGRPPKKRRMRKNPWDDDGEEYASDKEDEMEELNRNKTNGTRRRQQKKWNYSFEEEGEEMYVEAVIDDDDDDDDDEDDDDPDDDDDDESDGLTLDQNESMKMTVGNNNECSTGFNVTRLSQSQDIYYTMPGVPEASRMLSPVTVCNNTSEASNETGGVSASFPPGVTQNDILQIEMVRVGSPPSQLTEPENTTHPEQQGDPHTPVITQIFSLAVGTEADFERDPDLMELFNSLRQTVLPAHWVGVMAKGPILQLLQCSKLSTMADTVVQIEKGFFYQITVQNQPLLLMHSIYVRHPTCLTSVSDVVSLLLDLEGLSVCQGHQHISLGSPWEPRMCVRAALCDLLILKDEEQCEKCAQTTDA